jgi:hypothetical protein
VESAVSPTPGLTLELRLHVPDFAWPVMVETATVQWVSGQTFGLAFFRMAIPERLRLEHLINALPSDST